ncbi:uncharacterized protein METZ01_LOCUS351109, partial [marine metagenome]
NDNGDLDISEINKFINDKEEQIISSFHD